MVHPYLLSSPFLSPQSTELNSSAPCSGLWDSESPAERAFSSSTSFTQSASACQSAPSSTEVFPSRALRGRALMTPALLTACAHPVLAMDLFITPHSLVTSLRLVKGMHCVLFSSYPSINSAWQVEVLRKICSIFIIKSEWELRRQLSS